MRRLLKEISRRALLLNDFDFEEIQIKEKWLGYPPATLEQIQAAEQRLGMMFPADYKKFLQLTNGFAAFNTVTPSFLPVDKIDFLYNLDEDLIEIWNEVDPLPGLAQSILVGGLSEEQHFLLVPPRNASDTWEYWKFASWIPGEERYTSLKEYLQAELEFLRNETQNLTEPLPKIVVDYSLRDAAFALDWKEVFDTALHFIRSDIQFGYFNGEPDLFGMLLLAAYQTNRLEEYTSILLDFQQELASGSIKDRVYLNNLYLLRLYLEAAQQKLAYVPTLQLTLFQSQENPVPLKQIEDDLLAHMSYLAKPKHLSQKYTYIVYDLFRHGNVKEFLSFYSTHKEQCMYEAHFHAAIIYATLQENVQAKEALLRYYQQAMEYRPLAPFLHPTLLPLLDHTFLHQLKAIPF